MEAELEEVEFKAQCEKSDGKARHMQSDSLSKAAGPDIDAEQTQSLDSPDRASQVDPVTPCEELQRESVTGVKEHEDLPIHATDSGGRKSSDAQLHSRKRTKSCPPGVNRSVIFGPWSLEWLHDHNHGDARVIFSSKKKKVKAVERPGPDQ
ncbi:DUF4283 domain protein, partial [Trifolium medium]|nr:DUF4283 domain protein [Trifolium medium]